MIDEAAYREILEEHARNPKFDELLDLPIERNIKVLKQEISVKSKLSSIMSL